MKILRFLLFTLLTLPAFAQYNVQRTSANVVQTTGLIHPAPLVTTSLRPNTDDGATLGDTTHNWSDLFMASGGVFNWANGNVVITHTSGTLTMGTGDFHVTTAGTNAASVVTVGGTQTMTGKTLTAPVIATIVSGAGTNTLPTSTGTLLSTAAAVTVGQGGTGAATVAAARVALNITTQAISASDIDWALGGTHSKTLGANTTFTFSNAVDGETITVALTNTASNYTVTWPTVLWAGGVAPVQTIGAKTDVYSFKKIGSTIYGSSLQNMF